MYETTKFFNKFFASSVEKGYEIQNLSEAKYIECKYVHSSVYNNV